MCWMMLSAATNVVGSGGEMAGGLTNGIMGGFSQAEVADYNAQVAYNNAWQEEYAAREEIKQGKKEEGKARINKTDIMSQQRASYGASGVVVDSGSAERIVVDTDWLGEQDALNIRYDAAKRAHAHRTNAVAYANQTNQYLEQASAARDSSINKLDIFMPGTATLLSGRPLQSQINLATGGATAIHGIYRNPLLPQNLRKF